MNRSEQFVARLSAETFLSLWTYPTPKGKGGNELCDLLVVCDPDVVIVSVKEVVFKNTGDKETDAERWLRKAVHASAAQIYGAERWLSSAKEVVTFDGKAGLSLPVLGDRRVHRIAVALGGRRQVPSESSNLGKGFVHVFDDYSFGAVITELDTISDLTNYLMSKETLYTGQQPRLEGGEEDLLAVYLSNDRSFPNPLAPVPTGLYSKFIRDPQVLGRNRADKPSYLWDGLIESLSDDFRNDGMVFGGSLTEVERATRVMARETRFSRRMLGRAFDEFLRNSHTIRSRMLKALSGVVYVFLATPQETERRTRTAELAARCFVARSLHADSTTLIGLATEQYVKGQGYSLDVVYLYMPVWRDSDQAKADELKESMGFFKSPKFTNRSDDEYPRS